MLPYTTCLRKVGSGGTQHSRLVIAFCVAKRILLAENPGKRKALLKVDILTFSDQQGGGGTAVAQWLRCCATIRKVPGSIPAGVSKFFIDIKLHYGPGVDPASNRNE